MKSKISFLFILIFLTISIFSIETNSTSTCDFNDYFNFYFSSNDKFYSLNEDTLNLFFLSRFDKDLIVYYSLLLQNYSFNKNYFDVYLASNNLNHKLEFKKIELKNTQKMISLESITNLNTTQNIIINFEINLNNFFLDNNLGYKKMNISENPEYWIDLFFEDLVIFQAKEPISPITFSKEDFSKNNISKNFYYQLLLKENIFINNIFQSNYDIFNLNK